MKQFSFSLLCFVLCTSFLFLNFQTENRETTWQPPTNDLPFFQKKPGWYKMKPNARLTTNELLEKHHTDLGLGKWDEFKIYRTETDELGITHSRFQQYHQGIPVTGGELLVHEKAGAVLTFNGKWAKGLNLQATPAFSNDQAVETALGLLPAERYIWEDEGAETMLRRVKQQPGASFFPKPELVWLNPHFSMENQNFRLAYKMEIQAQIPLFRRQVYLDAISGEILQNINLLHETDVPGTAATKYSGTQQIVTDSIGPGMYRLREAGRGNGIETYDMNKSDSYGDAVDFMDTDNFWDNVNSQQDEAATDAHWAAEMTFDYMQAQHNYTGVDNNGMALISYVHYDQNLVNAFWNGSWASFGDGDGFIWKTLTPVDVVAHEFTHGITQFTAGLIYLNESGALNESFSDIIGATVEFWATPDQADWFMAEDAQLNGTGFRNMANPKSKGDPNTYLGINWYTGTGDSGGVHTNSGVQNYWFYLLTEGGSGTNDNGDSFAVEGVGLDSAAAIAVRNLRYYLTTQSGYADAREGALQAAEDLYGACSFAYIETARAWYAVGLGNAIADDDVLVSGVLYPTPIACGLTDAEFPLLQIRYNGCEMPIDAATEIPIAFQVDNGPVVNDTVVLAANLAGGEFLAYQSDQPVSGLEQMGDHVLRVWTEFDQDPNHFNDTLAFEIQNIIEQNTDFGMAAQPSPGSGCFLTNETVRVEVGFFGCDSIAMGTELNLFYSLNGGTAIMETMSLPQTIYAFETFDYTFSTPLDFTNALGANSVQSWVEFSPDFLNGNDLLDAQLVANPKPMIEEDMLTFEAGTLSLDSIYTVLGREADAFTSAAAAATGTTGIQMTGGDALNSLDELALPNELNTWQINEILSAKTCFCVDAAAMEDVQLSFDLKQTYSPLYLQAVGEDIPRASSLRVLANNQQISQTIFPSTNNSDPVVNHAFNVSQLAGTSFEICIETRNGLHPSFDLFGIGDNAYIDNIKIAGLPVYTSEVLANFTSLSITPNPNNGQFNIFWQSQTAGTVAIEVFDIFGKRLKKLSHRYISGGNIFSLSLETAAAGTYFVRLSNGGQAVAERVVVMGE